MIRVKPKREPNDFDAKVRQMGKAYLQTLGPGGKPKWSSHAYWKSAKRDLWESNDGICAYLCRRVPLADAEIDHFKPKSRHPECAYEWSNFRLCSPRINKKKGDCTVLDPFEVRDGSFRLVLLTGKIRLSCNGDIAYEGLCRDTIKRLGLNENANSEERATAIDDFLNGDMTLPYLKKLYPFVYSEIVRQGLDHAARRRIRTLCVANLRYEI